MSTVDIIVILVIGGLISLAITKIVRDKKRGVKCSGCSGCSECPACEEISSKDPQQ